MEKKEATLSRSERRYFSPSEKNIMEKKKSNRKFECSQGEFRKNKTGSFT